MLAEFSIFSMEGMHMSKDVAKVVAILEQSGLAYQVGPMGTCVEGDWDQVLTAIRHCHQSVSSDHQRVITNIAIDDRKSQPHHLKDMVAAVDHQLGGRVPTADMDTQC